jgi:F0F1-type ATP synthase membrane subunit b/b'
MHQYKDFIATCPDLNTAVKLHSSTSARSRFDFGVLRNFKMDISPPSIQDCSSPVLGSDGEPYVLVPDSEDVIQTTEDAIQEIPKLQSLQHQLQQLASKIETKFAETDAQIKRYEESLIDFASMIFGKFKNNINDFTENYLETQRVEITNMTQANQETLHDYICNAEYMFTNCLEEAIEHALQEINVTADDATEHMNQQAKQLIQEMTSH